MIELEPSYSAIKRSAKRFRNALCPTLQVLGKGWMMQDVRANRKKGWLRMLESKLLPAQFFRTLL